MGFREDFIWGAATASYQIEGAAFEDGRKPSVWDECAHRPGFVKNAATGDYACDHYHRFAEDIHSMEYLGLDAYRFSFSWSRVLNEGQINQKGLDFYDRLVDGLLEKNITPYATIFHWDYPTELYNKGGWLNPDSPKWFEEYTAVLAERFSGRIKNWMTLNEPQCFIDLGHRQAIHAPGIQLPFAQILQAAHNVLLAHGRAVTVLRDVCKDAKIGFAPVGSVCMPYTESDVEAARAATFSVSEFSLFHNTWWADPVFLGEYPKDGMELYKEFLPKIGQDDMKLINQELDFYGVNIYQGEYITVENDKLKRVVNPCGEFTAFDWPVTPDALYWGPKFLFERYKKPIFITENGMAGTDYINKDGKVIDDHRIVFTSKYLSALKKAASEGVDIRGYFHWSLIDNFEWAEGYTKRFGMIYVDFETGARTMKQSAHWYKDVIANNGCEL